MNDCENDATGHSAQVARLAALAREFNDPEANEGATDDFVLFWASSALAFGVAQVLGASHPLLDSLRKCTDSGAVEVWRQVAQLPESTIREMVIAVRAQRNEWALQDGEPLDLRDTKALDAL